MEDVSVTFDSEYKIRLFDEERATRSLNLEGECSRFNEHVGTFSEKVGALLALLENHADRIDAQKLRAIGMRMACESENEIRSRRRKMLQAMATEKRNELDRFEKQNQSLQRVEAEQIVLLEKITSA